MNSGLRVDNRRFIRRLVTFVVVTGCCLTVVWAMNPNFSLFPLHFDMVFPFIHAHNHGALFANTTTNGGDMGAHVWAPAYMRDKLLIHGRISGWAPDWFAGFPALHFYFPLPSLLIVGISAIHIPFTHVGIPYNVAFKMVTVLGVSTMPLSAYIMARCFGLKSPKPELLAIAVVTFVFNTSFSIFGGNIASTLAGEFAFSISMSASLIFIGLYWQVITEGKHRALAAVFLAIMITSHLLPTIFAFFVVLLMYLFHLDFSHKYAGRVGWAQLLLLVNGAILMFFGVQWGWVLLGAGVALTAYHVSIPRFKQGLLAGVIGVAIASIWFIPFAAEQRLSNDMGWGKEMKFIENLVKGPMHFALPLAIIGFILAFVKSNRLGILLGLAAVGSALVFVLAPQARLWNARALPFWYLTVTMLAAVGVGELLEYAASAWDSRYSLLPAGIENSWISILGMIFAGIISLGLILGATGTLPSKLFGVLPVNLSRFNAKDPSFVQSWAKWNYEGYESANKSRHDEYFALINAMGEVGKQYGCGRAMWEYEPEEDQFGTPMALMLLPYWTNHCIGSLEGLYFESAASAPYHWIIQDQMSVHPSDPQRDLPYNGRDLNVGTKHLQAMGVKYYMAITPQSQSDAQANPRLKLVKQLEPYDVNYKDGSQSRSWQIYEVKDSDIVAPLTNEPVVAKGPIKSQKGWLEMAMHWYTDGNDHNGYIAGSYDNGYDPTVYMTESGPSSWGTTNVNIQVPRGPKKPFWQVNDRTDRVGEDVTYSIPPIKALPAVNVSNIKNDDDSISFHVDKVGVPVLVKMSYFPNWQASGAKGPYRSTPNFMVVIPTKNDVTLHYGRTPYDIVGILFTILGLISLGYVARQGDVSYPDSEGDFWRSTRSYQSDMLGSSLTADMLRDFPPKITNKNGGGSKAASNEMPVGAGSGPQNGIESV